MGGDLAIEAPYAPRSSESVDGEECGEGVFPSPADGDYRDGECRKLPMQRGPGQSPGRKRFSVYLKLENVTLVMLNVTFVVRAWSFSELVKCSHNRGHQTSTQ